MIDFQTLKLKQKFDCADVTTMAPIPRVSLASLQRPVAHAKWEESVEALGVSLGKHNVVVLALSEHNAAQLHTAMIAFPLLFRGSDRASWPQTPAPLAGSLSAPGQERFDLRLGAESTMSLPELTRTAFCEVSSSGSCFRTQAHSKAYLHRLY